FFGHARNHRRNQPWSCAPPRVTRRPRRYTLRRSSPQPYSARTFQADRRDANSRRSTAGSLTPRKTPWPHDTADRVIQARSTVGARPRPHTCPDLDLDVVFRKSLSGIPQRSLVTVRDSAKPANPLADPANSTSRENYPPEPGWTVNCQG